MFNALTMDARLLKNFFLFLLAVVFVCLPIVSQAQTQRLTSQIVDKHARYIFYGSEAIGMAMVVVDDNQQLFRSFGETQPGSGIVPHENSLIRIASLTKLMTSEVLVKLVKQGTVKFNDPLRQYAPGNASVPYYHFSKPITLLNLATHTSGLPREQPGGAPHRAVFTWPNRAERWKWLQTAKIKVPPSVYASYSNLGFDLLSDALSNAAHTSYPQLFRKFVTQPNRMVDTTYTPTVAQCARLMKGLHPSPCLNTTAAAGSGGVYSTPADMGRWMKQFLPPVQYKPNAAVAIAQKMYFRRTDLAALKGMDVPGLAYELGMGWITMAPTASLPRIMQKTGGGGGFITYMAMVPQRGVGVFIVVTRSKLTRFKNMSDRVNNLVADLVRHKEI